MTQHIELDLSQDVLAEVEVAVVAGEYASLNEVLDQALRAWLAQRAIDTISTKAICNAWDEAEMDGPPGDEPEAVFARLMARYPDHDHAAL